MQMSRSADKRNNIDITKNKIGSLGSIFIHVDAIDKFLMTLGFLGAVGDGLSTRMLIVFNSGLMNNMGRGGVFDEKKMIPFFYLALASMLTCFLEGFCWTRTGERQATKMRRNYLKAVLRQEVAYLDSHQTSASEVVISMSNDIQIIQDVLSDKVPDFVNKVSLFVTSYVIAFVLMWKLALVGLPFLLLLVLPGWICGRNLTRISGKRRQEHIKTGTIAEQAISSIRTVYAYVGENKTITQFSAAIHGSTKLGLKQGLVKGLAIGSTYTVFAIWAVMSYLGSRMVIYHGALGGTVFAVGVSIINGGMAMGYALSNLKYFADACSAGENIMKVINRVPEIDSENMEGTVLDNVSGEVQFDHLKFAYPSRPESIVLNNFSLTVPAGNTVALVGSSGSGKSTATLLLQRFYNPLEGHILLDGFAIDKLQLKWLRSIMASVSQEPSLFSTTIKENILFGKEDGTMEEVVEAAIASNAHNFISQLPNGYDTQVGERGVQVSGGQKQRIAIARALIKKPKILLLDEATSALDSESEGLVQEALHRAATGRTTLVIAHRLSTIQKADVIAVMQNGSVMELGSHDELIQQTNGVYASFVCLQQTPQKETPEDQGPSSSLVNLYDSTSTWHLDSTSQLVASDSTSTTTAQESRSNLSKQKSSYWRLLSMNIPEWKQAVLAWLCAIFFGAVEPLYGFTMGTTLSIYFLTNPEEIKAKITTLAFCFFGLSVIALLINLLEHYSFAYIGEHLSNRIREMMLTKILSFEVGWFDDDRNSSGAICSKLTKDAEQVRSLVGDRMCLLIQTISAVTIAWTMGLIIAWRLAVVVIATQPIIIMGLYTRRVLLSRMSSKAVKSQEESCKLAAEAIYNLRTITSFSAQSRILKMLEKVQEGPHRESLRQSWFAGIGLGFSMSTSILIVGLSYWYGSRLVSQDYLTPRAVFETILILLTTGRVIADAGSMTSDLAHGWDAIGSIFGILDRTTRIEPQVPKDSQVEKLMGEVHFLDVYFAYPTRPNVMIFQGFSMNIEAGKSTALVGQSGSGKSTVIGLIERFYDPIRGVVEIDGRDIKSYNLRSLRKHMALVSQEPTLFAGTIRENIVFGASENMDETMVIEAARAANAHEFISALKDGYDTSCGDRGLQLSGGQKQRIAIARAILRNPAVLLLDEATSALDSQSEKVVQEALEHVMVGRTSVVVAHRLSTIQNCDHITVLDKGKVVEKGSHSSLLAKGPSGAYYSLVNFTSRSTQS
ncbi:PREDICTED: ABC transporter B family member 15-like [Fragaria vesca subsp. vesca]